MPRWQSGWIWTPALLGRGSCRGSVCTLGSVVLLPWLSCCQGNEPFKTRQVASNSSLVQKPLLLLGLRHGLLIKAVCLFSASSWLEDFFWSWKIEARWLESQYCEWDGWSLSPLPLVWCCPGHYLSSSQCSWSESMPVTCPFSPVHPVLVQFLIVLCLFSILAQKTPLKNLWLCPYDFLLLLYTLVAMSISILWAQTFCRVAPVLVQRVCMCVFT